MAKAYREAIIFFPHVWRHLLGKSPNWVTLSCLSVNFTSSELDKNRYTHLSSEFAIAILIFMFAFGNSLLKLNPQILKSWKVLNLEFTLLFKRLKSFHDFDFQ